MAQLRNNAGAVLSRMDQAARNGLTAAANVYRNAVKRELAGGYTSGKFVTGHGINAVTQTAPERESGGLALRVGTNAKGPNDYSYPLGWELGHFNIFSGRYERVPIWLPALTTALPEMQAALARVYRRTMTEGAIPTLGTQLEMNPAASPEHRSPEAR